MSTARAIRILLVEDDPDDAHLVRSLLEEQEESSFAVSWHQSLAAGLADLAAAPCDAVLLDLSLPDSQGFDGLREINRLHREVPVVVLTGLSDAGNGLEALGLGAEDYLLKTGLDRNLLSRALRYARERRALNNQLEELRERERHDREQAAFARLLAPPRTSVTAQLYGSSELPESSPQLYAELVQRYGDLLESHFSEAPQQGERAISRELQTMSESLGLMYAGPRDVIRIHQEALRRGTASATDLVARAMGNEGRLMLVELMGYLLAYYRCQATGIHLHPAAMTRPRGAAPAKDN